MGLLLHPEVSKVSQEERSERCFKRFQAGLGRLRPGPKRLIRDTKHVTRRKLTVEEKIRIVLKGFRRDTPIRDLCRREGIRPSTYYAWLKDFMEAGKERLTRDTVRDVTRVEVEDLKRENERLKQLVAELSLQVHVLKKTAVPGLE